MSSRFHFRVPLLIACVLLAAAAASAQNVTVGDDETLSIKGFINVSLFAQDQKFSFGQGTNAEFPAPPEYTDDPWILDGDVRNSRLTLAWGGPKMENEYKVNGVLEIDFHGGFNGTSAFADEQPTPRLRLAYMDLVRGKTTWRFGQAWSPIFGNVAQSYSHVAFPLGYGGGGQIGWRFPGIFMYRDTTGADSKVKTKLTAAIMSGSWNGPGDTTSSGSAGEASFGPQVEVRYDWETKAWGLYVAGHYDKKDLTGAGVSHPDDSLDGTALEVGGKFRSGPFSLTANLYQGTAIGHIFGNITQFGDVSGWGAWTQLGYDFTKKWSGYVFYGMDDPDDEDVLASIGNAGRTKNDMYALSLMYNLSRYGFDLEYIHDTLKSGPNGTKTDGNQIAASFMYKF
ncbi:MAG: hypothetical protein WC538_01490 [Thermoanaerobaculia bacterium]